jgi:hypothetical protein
MKTKLTLFFFSLIFICSAQSSLKYLTFNLDDVREFSDSIALNTKDVFKKVDEGIPIDNKIYYVITYTNTADASDSIIVMFRINYIGGTGDAVNPGTPQYSFNKATGKFNSLFPFWLNFMKPEAIQADILGKKKDETIVKGATYDFNEVKTHWKIEKF